MQEMGRDPSSLDQLPNSVKRTLLKGLRKELEKRTKTIESFVGFNFPRERVEAVLKSLGPDATDDDIRAQLVRVSGTPAQPAGNQGVEAPMGNYLLGRSSEQPSTATQVPQRICPYGDQCTFGNKCRYLHPEQHMVQSDAYPERGYSSIKEPLLVRGPEEGTCYYHYAPQLL